MQAAEQSTGYKAIIRAIDRAPYGIDEIMASIEGSTLSDLACAVAAWSADETGRYYVEVYDSGGEMLATTSANADDSDQRRAMEMLEVEPDQLWDWIEAREGKDEADATLRRMGYEVD